MAVQDRTIHWYQKMGAACKTEIPLLLNNPFLQAL